MKKENLLKVLETHKDDDYHFTGGRDYHEPETIMDIIRDVISDADDEIDEPEDLQDSINEYADSATPVYNHDLAKWFGDNWMAYDEISDELGRDGMGDNIMRGIALAYCLTLEREIASSLQAVWDEAEELEDASAICAICNQPEDEDGRCKCTNEDGK